VTATTVYRFFCVSWCTDLEQTVPSVPGLFHARRWRERDQYSDLLVSHCQGSVNREISFWH